MSLPINKGIRPVDRSRYVIQVAPKPAQLQSTLVPEGLSATLPFDRLLADYWRLRLLGSVSKGYVCSRLIS